MNRRRFLGLASGALAGGAVLGSRESSWAQAAPASRPGAKAVPPAAVETPTASAPGVSARDVKLGMSAAFKGPAAGLGTELWRGATAYFTEINARGGVHGRSIVIAALDDGYQPDPCLRNTIQLVEQEQVFCLSNYVGTQTLTRALPIIKRYGDVLLVGALTGAQPQRERPYVDYVFNVRASDRQEMAALVERFWGLGARKLGVFYQVDAYGRSGADAVERALAARGARIAAEATYVRGARFEDDQAPAVAVLKQAGCDAVLCTGAYQGCAAFVRAARDAGVTVPISNVSFVGADAMLALLLRHGKATGRDYVRALVNSQVMPSYDEMSLPGVAEYRALMDKHHPTLPEALRDKGYTPPRYSFTSLEGFVNAKVTVEALRRAGANPTRASFKQALESLQGVDLGIGAALTFAPERHQGLDSVYFTRVQGERWVPITDWTAAVRA